MNRALQGPGEEVQPTSVEGADLPEDACPAELAAADRLIAMLLVRAYRAAAAPDAAKKDWMSGSVHGPVCRT